MNSLMKLHKGEKEMKVLKFNIYCNTAKEAIAEINALMSEYKEKLLEFNVNIMLDEQKEPIDLTIDSEKLTLIQEQISNIEERTKLFND